MKHNRRNINILLLLIDISLAGVVAYMIWLPPFPVKESHETAQSAARLSDNMAKAETDFIAARIDTADSYPVTENNTDIHEGEGAVKIEDHDIRSVTIKGNDMKSMVSGHPFFKEAAKVLSGKLELQDSVNRRNILNYCEHFRTSYTTKDIDFLRQVFSDNALIIVGHTVKASSNNTSEPPLNEKVRYSLHSKQVYLERLEKVFESNKKIDISFSDFKIMRHPTRPEIYGVSLRQNYRNDSYSDDGYLFLLWDFSNRSMPLIHVRTWQPASSVAGDGEIIGIEDFYF